MPKGKRKSGLVPIREPSGRLQRSVENTIGAAAPTEAKRLRDAALRDMAAPEWATELGRLFLAGKIAPVLYEAGKRWAGLADAYHRATGAPPPGPSSSAFFKTPGGRQAADPDTEEGERQREHDERIVQAMTEALAIVDSLGGQVARVLRRTCEENVPLTMETDLRHLTTGLSWLAQHWGLDEPAKR